MGGEKFVVQDTAGVNKSAGRKKEGKKKQKGKNSKLEKLRETVVQ